MGVSGTGPFSFDAATGPQAIGGFTNYYFCSDEITTTDNYADNQLDFGVPMNTIVIINADGNDLAFQWIQQDGTGYDAGIVKANSQVVLRQTVKRGMNLRSRVSGAATSAIVYAT